MIIEFSFLNFRSVKDEQFFSMEAEKNKNKQDNTFEINLLDGTRSRKSTSIKLVKSAVIYGANASGKTNFIRAFAVLKYLVTKSNSFKVDKKIGGYEPFELEEGYETKPTKFQITFVAKDLLKYQYEIEYTQDEIFVEKLTFYPKGQPAMLFERVSESSQFHQIKFGDRLENKPNRKVIFKNQLILSKFGSDEPHEQLTEIYRYFDNLEVTKRY